MTPKEEMLLRSIKAAAKEFTEWDWLRLVPDCREKEILEADLYRLEQRILEFEKEETE